MKWEKGKEDNGKTGGELQQKSSSGYRYNAKSPVLDRLLERGCMALKRSLALVEQKG
jgi:hypothetical protein